MAKTPTAVALDLKKVLRDLKALEANVTDETVKVLIQRMIWFVKKLRREVASF